ncbi:MAG: DEAD/DEAH box helicase, partial [Synergistales bacterium]|nr:DEAD/DEAH box helicase [Synergistales bacterium]
TVAPLEMSFTGELRDYQSKAVQEIRQHGSGLLQAPCGSGKTVMLSALLAEVGQRSMVLCHTVDLARQLRTELSKWLDRPVGLLGGGVDDLTGEVDVSTVQSLYSDERRSSLADRYGLIALDECHHAPARCFSQVVQSFSAAYRYGLTATPERSDGLTPLLQAVIGPTRAVVPPEALEGAGVRVRASLLWRRGVEVDVPADKWTLLLSKLGDDTGRAAILADITEDLLSDGHTVLVLVPRVSAISLLGEELSLRGINALGISGKTKKADRPRILEAVRSGDVKVLVAVNVADEGLDLPELSALVLAAPSRSPAKAEQRVGRILRPCAGKPDPVLVDVVDYHGALEYQARCRFFDVWRRLCEGAQKPSWL